MTNLVESPKWEEGIYQLETSDPVMGGPDGVDNKQAKQLANRTLFLRQQGDSHASAKDPHPQYATKTNLADEIAAAAPPGAICHFARSTAPTGWLKANGAAVSRTAYASLFAAIGTTYGTGNGSTTFTLPDLRGEFVRGWDDARGIDVTRSLGSWQNHAFLSHSHRQATTNGVPGGYCEGVGSHSSYTGIDYIPPVPTDVEGGSETRPRNVALLACIKY